MHKKGSDCEFSHTNAKDSRRANSPARGRRSVCYASLQGKCTKGKECKYLHDKKSSVKAAAAMPRASPANTPRASNPKASRAPKAEPKASALALVVHSDDESYNDSFCSDISTMSELGKGCLRNPNVKNCVRKDVKLKFSNQHDGVKFHVHSDKHWSKSVNRKRLRRRVSEKELPDRNRTEQIRFEEVRSMTKALALERFMENPQEGKAPASINGTWKLNISINNNPKAPDLFVEANQG